MELNIVKIEDTSILVNGVKVGTVTKGKEVYVNVDLPEFRQRSIARFKYMSPRTKAVTWVKFVFARLSVAEILEKLNHETGTGNVGYTPLGLAYSLGFPKPTVPASVVELDWTQKPASVVVL